MRKELMTLVVLNGFPAISELPDDITLCYCETASDLVLVHHVLALVGTKCGFHLGRFVLRN